MRLVFKLRDIENPIIQKFKNFTCGPFHLPFLGGEGVPVPNNITSHLKTWDPIRDFLLQNIINQRLV